MLAERPTSTWRDEFFGLQYTGSVYTARGVNDDYTSSFVGGGLWNPNDPWQGPPIIRQDIPLEASASGNGYTEVASQLPPLTASVNPVTGETVISHGSNSETQAAATAASAAAPSMSKVLVPALVIVGVLAVLKK